MGTTIIGLDKIADFIMPHIGNLFPGCIVGCADSTQKFSVAFGLDTDKHTMTSIDVFDIASITKSMLNVLTLKLIPFDELDQKIIDEIPMEGMYRDQITVKHLLTFGVEYGDQIKLSKIKARGELMHVVRNGNLQFPPGSTYRYTNVSSMLLSFFLQKKFGKSFDDLLHDELLLPLGMNMTTFTPLSIMEEFRIVQTEAGIPRGIVQDESARIIEDPTGSAGLFSTMDDLLTFGQSFLGENTYLPKDLIAQMPISQFENAAMTFGLGMGLRHQNECDLVNPDGTPVVVLKKNGFSGAHFCVLPENNFCFVVFGTICYPKRPSAEGRDRFTNFHKKLLRLMYENRSELL